MADDVNRDGEGTEATRTNSSGGADDLFLFGEQDSRRPKREEAEADLSDLEGSRAADDVTNPNIHMGIERADTYSSGAVDDGSTVPPRGDAAGRATPDTVSADDGAETRAAQPSPLEGGLTEPGESVQATGTRSASASPAPESLVEERPDVERVGTSEASTDFGQAEISDGFSERPGGGSGVFVEQPGGPERVNAAPQNVELSNLSFDENAPGAVIGQLTAYDPNGSAGLTFTVDDARFEIVDGQLKLRPGMSFNHEVTPEVSVTITVTDAGGLSFEQTFNLLVGDVNEGPLDISLSNASVAENAAGAVVGTLSTSDVDAGDSHTYAVDDARFEVVGGELKLKDGVSLDHETEESVDVTVTTTDSGGATYTETFSITVGDVNEGPTDISLSNASVAENAAGAVVGTLSTTDVDAGDSHTYAVDDARFEVVGGELKLKDGVSLDHETESSVDVTVTTTDSGGATYTETFSIAVGDVNEGPSDISLSNASVAENAAGAVVGTLSTTDVDAGDSHTYAVDDTRFEVVGGELKLKDGVSLDHETESSVDVTVTTTDSGGATYTETFSITVGDVNEGPTDISLSNASVAENAAGAVVGTLSTTDPDAGDSHTYAVDDARFEVVGGELKLKDGVSLDHDTEASVDVTVTTTDSGGATYTETFSIAVGDVNEGPTDISLSNASVAENAAGAVVGTLSTTDPDAGDSHTYAVDDARFEIVGGELKLKDGVSLDHETEASVDVTVTTTDSGGATYSETFSIAVGDVNEGPTDISLSNASVAENAAGAVVGTLSTSDVDAGDSHTYAVDDARFEVVGGELKLKDGVSLDHETEASVDVTVTTTDSGGATYIETFSITVGDVNEAPTDISLSNASVAENAAGAVVGTLSTTDVDAGDSHTYAVDDARFEVVGGELKLKDGVSLDHETESSVDVTVTTTDSGGATYTETFSITVGDVNEAPSDISLSNASVAENAAGAVVGTLATTDVDAGDSHTYAVDDARFEVVGGELKLKDGVSLNHEAEASVDVTVTTTDSGGATYTETFSIAVGDVNEGPTDISLSNASVAENAAGAVVGTLSTTDVDAGDSHTYAVDDARFEVVGGELKLKDGVSLDHETESSVDVTVTTTDSGGATYTETFSIAVGDVNEGPTDISLSNASVAENAAGAVVGTLSTTDVDEGDSHTYAVDDARFEVVGGELKLKDGVSLDHETESSVDVTVTTTDSGGATYTETFSIAVGDVNEAPTDIVTNLDQGNLITNGSFEQGTSGWNAAAGHVEVNAANVYGVSGADGNKVMELDAGKGQAERIYQDVQTNDGQTYSLSVDIAQRAGTSSSTNTVEIYWNGQLVDSIDPSSTAMETFSFQVVGTGGMDRLEFREPLSDNNSLGGVIDNVQLVPTLPENAENGDLAAVVTAVVDPDSGDTHTFTLTDDAGGAFEIDPTSGRITVADTSLIDYETATSIDVTVEVTDSAGNTYQEVVTINIGDVNEVPSDISLSNASVAENTAGAIVGTLSTTDVDAGDSHTYAVDDARFEVVGGELKLKDGVSLDHDTEASVDVTVTTTDSGGATYTETFSIAVGDLNEGPTDISLSNASVAENATGAVVGTLSTTDPDAGDSHTYAVDDARFEIVGGELKLKDGVSLNHEAESSVDVTVTTTDSGGATYTETFSIAVGDVNEGPTDISLSNASVAENAAGAVVGTLSTSDVDAGDSHTYAVDDARFEVVGGELKLKDGVSLDHETEASVDVTVTTTDSGGATYTETFSIAVGDVNEGPTDISLSNASVAENAAGAVVGTLSTSDVDAGDSHTYAVDDARFEVVGGELKLKDGVSLDHEAEASVDVTVTTTDSGGATSTETFSIAVGDVNEGPTDISLSNASVAENAAGAVVGTLSTTDVDAGDSHTYAVDDARFEVVGGELKLKDGVSLDHEAEASVDVTVTTTDSGGATYTETFSIAVGDVNEGPSDISLSNASVAENAAGAVVGTLSTTDVDAGDSHTYAVDDARFEVVGGELKLKDGVSLDHETEASVDVTVTTTDSGGATYTETFSIAVGDVNEGPVAGNVDLGSTNEDNAILISTDHLLANSSDVDGDALSITSLSVDPAFGSLADNGNGTWTFTPTDDMSAENVAFSFTVSDGTASQSATATLDVKAVADQPTLNIGSVSSTRTIINSSFEGSDQDFQSSVDGWSTDSDAIEVWSEAQDGQSASHGDNYVELNNDKVDHYDDANDVYQNVQTVDGASYTLTFDLSPRPGYDASVNRIDVVWDGQVIDTISLDGSGNSDNVWQSFSYTLEGDGDISKLQFREAGTDVDYGRGMRLDNVVLTETVEGVQGNAGEAIDLPDLSASLGDVDGSESLALVIGNIPDGAILTDGTNSFTAGSGSTSTDVSGWSLNDLQITLPASYEGSFDLSVTATATEASNGSTATTTGSITVNVDEAESNPQLLWSEDFSGLSNGAKVDTGDTAWSATDTGADITGGHGVSNGAYEFDQNTNNGWDTTSKTIWKSEPIDISGQADVDLSFKLSQEGGMESSGQWQDWLKVYAIVDGVRTELSTQNGAMDGDAIINLQNIGEGSSLVIEFESHITGGDEHFAIDDIRVVGNHIDGTATDRTILEDPGNTAPSDTVTIHGGNGSTNGTSGDDVMLMGSGDKLDGKDGNDILIGGNGNDKLEGGDGNDTLYGRAGNDELKGENGNDTLYGGTGNDKLDGGNGDDILVGGQGNDELKGGKGDDILFGGAGDDTMKGEDGSDLFIFQTGNGDHDYIEGGTGGGWTDTIQLQANGGGHLDMDWTLSLDSGSIDTSGLGSYDLSDDASGTITFADGSEITFSGIERIEW